MWSSLILVAVLASPPVPGGATGRQARGTGPGGVQAPRPNVQPDDDAGYYFLLGRHLEGDDKIDEAIVALKRAVELSGGAAEVQAELAALYARQDRAQEALDAAEAALARDGSNREANRVLGSVLAAVSDRRTPLRPGDDPSTYAARAIVALEEARREGILDVNLELMLGRLYMRAGNTANAIPSLTRVVADQPGYPDAAMMLATALETAGRAGEAIDVLQTSMAANPTFFRGWLRLAQLADEQRRPKDAAAAYAQAQIANPKADMTSPRAAALINAGEPAAARTLIEAALTRSPGSADAGMLYLLGQAQRRLKDLTAAAQTVERLKTRAPADPRALYLSAQVFGDLGRTTEAIAAFQELMTRSPEDASLVYEYSNLLQKAGHFSDAERALREVIARDPIDANALNALGYMFAERAERLDEAVTLLERALKVEPGNPSFLDSLGWAYFQQGRIDRADAPLTDAAAKLPSSSAVQEHLGDLRFRQQRYGEAAAAWERSLAGDGEAIDRARIEKKVRDVQPRLKK